MGVRRKILIAKWMIGRTSDHGQETEPKVVWLHVQVFWFRKHNSAWHSERKKGKRWTEEKIGRHYQTVDKDGLCQHKQSS